MQNENSSDLFGDSVEEVDCHECGKDAQEKRSINSEDKERMLFLITHQERNTLPFHKAKALVNRFI